LGFVVRVLPPFLKPQSLTAYPHFTIEELRMYCPQCGTESSSGLQFCRSCGANLKVIGKAVALSEAIARSDRGPLPRVKEMIKNLKLEQVTEEVSRALDRMNQEIADTPSGLLVKEKKTAAERRENNIVKGMVSLFSGIGLMIFLYYFSAALVLKLPPEAIAKIPFELEPVVRMIWLVGLMPTLSGAGHIIAGLLIRPKRADVIEQIPAPEPSLNGRPSSAKVPGSVTERTTHLLDSTGSSPSD
jgi:hypothetical protein